ncbi:MAG: hypothetical protein O3C40_19800 [Planctomycetota bacterium]|nr:hypothetical protein [Planctomycetota bacterium]
MADSCSRLIDELFVPTLALVDELSQATNDDEAIEHFACDKSKLWCQVGQALGQTGADQLPGQDLPEAVQTIAAIYEGTGTQCNTYPDVAIYIFRRLGTLKQAAQRGWTAAKQGGTIPEDPHPVSELPATMEVAGDGQIRLADWAVAAHGVLLHQINLGPRPAFGNKFPISDFDAIVVDGDTPSVCPKTDRPVDAIWLPEILEVFKRCGMVKSGQTIHWVGSQAKLENVCTCFREGFPKPAATLTGNAANGGDLIERLLAGPDDAELSPRELALLEAYLQQPVSMAAIQREKQATGESETNAKRNKLKLIRDFNRNLQGPAPAANEAKLAAETQESTNRSPALIEAGNGAQGDDEAEFRWTVPVLEGYVFAVLKEVEYPTERDAVASIAAKSRKREPARATLRKTYAWQNRPQKTPKPHTTNEAQSGVSPAQNADVEMPHEEVTNAVLDIEEKFYRQLKDDERAAVAWTLQEAGADEKARDEAIAQLIQGFRSGDM